MLSHQSADAFQMQSSHSRRTYDHRIQEAICESGDRDLFPELEIPRSTIRSWIHRGIPDVLTCDSTAGDRAGLLAEIHRYQRRTALLGAIVGLLIAMLRVSKVRLDYERLPEGDTKKVLLRALGRAGKVLSLSAVLRITRLSSSRYHDWCFADAGCDLDDQSSCPRVVPTRLTPANWKPYRRWSRVMTTDTCRCTGWHFTHSALGRSSPRQRRDLPNLARSRG